MVAALLLFLFRATTAQRMTLIVASPLAVIGMLSAVPSRTILRITSFVVSADASEEAIESRESREYLLSKSIEYTIHYPLFGVGPGQFAEYEGRNNRLGGTTHGSWHETHNTFTQVSSECGIPAFLFFLAAIISSFLLLNSTYRDVCTGEGCEDMRAMVFCVMLGMTGFCVSIFFLSFAYFYYVPALGGLAISVSCAAREELLSRNSVSVPVPV
jgi:O-antigen ligase